MFAMVSVTAATGTSLDRHRRVTVGTGGGQTLGVVSPQLFLTGPEKIEVIPGIDATVMTV
jgi:hypothetical protein